MNQAINLQMGFSNNLDDDIRERAEQIRAVGDLLSRVDDCAAETAVNAGWLIRTLAEQIRERLELEG